MKSDPSTKQRAESAEIHIRNKNSFGTAEILVMSPTMAGDLIVPECRNLKMHHSALVFRWNKKETWRKTCTKLWKCYLNWCKNTAVTVGASTQEPYQLHQLHQVTTNQSEASCTYGRWSLTSVQLQNELNQWCRAVMKQETTHSHFNMRVSPSAAATGAFSRLHHFCCGLDVINSSVYHHKPLKRTLVLDQRFKEPLCSSGSRKLIGKQVEL